MSWITAIRRRTYCIKFVGMDTHQKKVRGSHWAMYHIPSSASIGTNSPNNTIPDKAIYRRTAKDEPENNGNTNLFIYSTSISYTRPHIRQLYLKCCHHFPERCHRLVHRITCTSPKSRYRVWHGCYQPRTKLILDILRHAILEPRHLWVQCIQMALHCSSLTLERLCFSCGCPFLGTECTTQALDFSNLTRKFVHLRV